MIFLHYTAGGLKRTADLSEIFANQSCMLVGGAPTLHTQPLELLANRGVLACAMNNSALHFQPTLWCSVDRPECFEPQILLDPRIMKFGNIAHAEIKLDGKYNGKRFYEFPNTFFYLLKDDVPWSEYLAPRREIPWYSNTLFTSIYLLYYLGIRRIVLAGSDFGTANGHMYAHTTKLTDLQTKWNTDLYDSQVHELRRMKPVFEQARLEFYDCSVNSRLKGVYEHISFEKAVELCTQGFPQQPLPPASLPHCSVYATQSIQERIAKWPGYRVVGVDEKAVAGNQTTVL
jgi:hypothetical protein